jgi:dUTP pyrophosphatase
MKGQEPINILFQKLEHFGSLPLPQYETAGSAGMDIRAANSEPVTLKPGERQLIPTGLKMALPKGYEAQIRPRSGLAYRSGITMLNTPGTIDSDYRGEVKVLAVNLGEESFVIRHGDRIAQIVIAPILQAVTSVVDELPDTSRGEGGFGSTGLK